MKRIEIDVLATENYSEVERKKFLEAMHIGELVLNSEEFRDAILSAPQFKESKGKSNLEVWQHIMTGRDKFDKEDDHSIQVHVVKYYSWKSKTIGYTYASVRKYWANFKYHKNYSRASIFSNTLHESMHNFGYGHRYTHSGTVPYEVGYIGRRLANDALNGKKLTPLPSES